MLASSANRIRRCRSPMVVGVTVLLLGGTSYSAVTQVPSATSGSHNPDGLVDPPSIPVSAVAISDNCDRISRLEEQLQPPPGGKDFQRIQGPEQTHPLSASGKFRLAMKNFSDPLNIAGTALDSAISNATSSSKSAFGTGWPGFGRRFGMSMSDEGLSEFFSTYLISSLAHQDPHYHRDSGSSTGRRI